MCTIREEAVCVASNGFEQSLCTDTTHARLPNCFERIELVFLMSAVKNLINYLKINKINDNKQISFSG